MRAWNILLGACFCIALGVVAADQIRNAASPPAGATPINMKIGNTGAGGVELSQDRQVIILPQRDGTFTSGTISLNGLLMEQGATLSDAHKMLRERKGSTVVMTRPAREFVVQLIPPEFPEQKDANGKFAPVINHIFRVQIPGYRARIFAAELGDDNFTAPNGTPDYSTTGTVINQSRP